MDTPARHRSRLRRVAASTADALATALALATLAGVALDVVRSGSAVHPLWMGTLGSAAFDAFVAAAFAVLVLAGSPVARRDARWARGHLVLARGVGLVVAAACVVALARHAFALAAGRVLPAGVAPPFALVGLAVVLSWTLRLRILDGKAPARASRLARGSGVAAALAALVFLHIAAMGATDYRGHADAILVFGSKVKADGKASGSLVDRTRTACALWREGYAPVLVLSGGWGDAPVSEPQAMRAIALAEGVPDAAIVLDESGVDTAASVAFAKGLARERAWERVLAVSHDYHLARVRLLAARAGLSVRTVPARETCTKGWKWRAVPREVLAYVAAFAF